MSSSSNDTIIEQACRSFAKSVIALIEIIKKRRGRNWILHSAHNERDARGCERLTRHGNHVLRTLTAKRTSLKHAIAAFEECSEECVKRFSSLEDDDDDDDGSSSSRSRSQQDILKKWFANYLRLRDGFVLLESGEKRHLHDGDDSDGTDVSKKGVVGKSNNNNINSSSSSNNNPPSDFSSKLTGALRRDGRTRKFSSRNGYSGAAYDEAYDEDVGIKKRLSAKLAAMHYHGGGDGDGAYGEDAVWEKLLRRGARSWEDRMDEHIDASIELRSDLNRIQKRFVDGINGHIEMGRWKKKKRRRSGDGNGNNGNAAPDNVKLVTDDKSERITLGLWDAARQGNAFVIRDKGGSLPFGMTVQGWRIKFGLEERPLPKKQQRGAEVQKAATVPKKRKYILEDSDESSDEEDGAYEKTHSSASASNGHDGLAVRKRRATDVTNAANDNSNSNNEKTSSIDEMKRRLGVNNARLEQSREQVEEENLHSKMAADDEDMQQDMLGDAAGNGGGGGNGTVISSHATIAPLLNACLQSRTELRKNGAYVKSDANSNTADLLWTAQEYWDDFDESLVRWKEAFQELLKMRKDGLLLEEGSSDHAYTVRENFREANMQVGNDCMEVYDFFCGQLQRDKKIVRSSSSTSALSSLHVSLLKICHSYLQFAEETFKTSLGMVLEQERCQVDSHLTNIQNHWEKGQHLLLRGRAHHNIGRAKYELAQYYESTASKQQKQQPGNQKNPNKDLLTKARKEIDNAILRAKSLRHNTVVINRHPDAKDASTQNIQCTWTGEATIHLFEATKLELLSSGLHIACSWKLDDAKSAEDRFDELFQSVEIADVLGLAGAKEGVSQHIEVTSILEDMYLFAKSAAGFSARSLEGMTKKKGWNALEGGKLLQMTCKAMKRTASISDNLLSLVDCYSLDFQKERIATKAMIEKEEGEICRWWEQTKAQAQMKLSDITGGSRALHFNNLPRTEVAGDIDVTTAQAAELPRRIFIQDGSRSLHQQGRSYSTRALPRSVKKANNLDHTRTVTERFSSEFGAGSSSSTFVNTGDQQSESLLETVGQNDNDGTKYRKWGNEVLEEHERRRCCPPLTEGLPIEVKRALENELGDILPMGNQFCRVSN